MKSVVNISIGLIISILFLFLTLRGIAWNSIWISLLHGRYIYIIPAILIHFISFYIRAYKWSLIVSKIKKIGSNEIFPIISIGLAMNNILPLKAGEFGRIFILSRKYGISKVDAGISIIIERLFDIIGLLFIILAFIHFRIWPSTAQVLLNTSSILVLMFVILTPILLYYGKAILSSDFLKRFEGRSVFTYISEHVYSAHGTYFKYHDVKLILKLIIWSVILWIIEGLSYYILSFVFGFHISLVDFLFVCAVINLSSAIPSSPGAIGTFEFFATTLLVFLGITKSSALTYVLVLHIELLLPITLVGIYFYFLKRYDRYIRFQSLTKVYAE